MTHSGVLLKSQVVGIQISQFMQKEVDNHRPIVLIIDSNSLVNVVLSEMCIDDVAIKKTHSNSECTLFVHISMDPEVGFIAKYDFSVKIMACCQMFWSTNTRGCTW